MEIFIKGLDLDPTTHPLNGNNTVGWIAWHMQYLIVEVLIEQQLKKKKVGTELCQAYSKLNIGFLPSYLLRIIS